MKISIFIISFLYALLSWGESIPNEEAIILNQEMQFLEESANNIQIMSSKETNVSDSKIKEEFIELEEEYFGKSKEKEKSISTKSAAPKRRSL